jgi:hypothetical protein
MRVTSELFVSALIRQTFSGNGFAAVIRKGAVEAGAILVIVDRLDGTYDLYAPAPQAFFEDGDLGRLFENALSSVRREDVEKRLESEARMDPDFWVVEVESADGKVALPLAKDQDAHNPADDFFRL